MLQNIYEDSREEWFKIGLLKVSLTFPSDVAGAHVWAFMSLFTDPGGHNSPGNERPFPFSDTLVRSKPWSLGCNDIESLTSASACCFAVHFRLFILTRWAPGIYSGSKSPEWGQSRARLRRQNAPADLTFLSPFCRGQILPSPELPPRPSKKICLKKLGVSVSHRDSELSVRARVGF